MLISLGLITNRISFGTHVATVRDYLNWYRVANNEMERRNGSTMFAEYLVSACWRKMERRIGHWASVGLMSRLYDLTFDQLSASPIDDQGSRNATRSDFKLSAYLRTLQKAGNLKKILLFYKKRSISSNEFEPVISDIPCLLLRCRDNPHDLYNTETVVEFHCLLVACLLYYAKSLRDLRIFHMVDKGVRILIELIINHERNQTAQELKKKSRNQFKPRKGDNANVAFESSVTVEESEERKEGNLETKDSQFSAQLKSLIDKTVNNMSSFGEVLDAKATVEEKQLKKIAKLKSYLDEKLNKTPLSLDNVTPEAAEEAKQGENLLRRLKIYFDMRLSPMPTPLPATNSKDMFSRKDKFGAVFYSSRILNALLVSGAFQRHIEILVNRRLLDLPSDQLQTFFRKFAEERGIPCRQTRAPEVPQTVREIGNADLDPKDGDDGEFETDEVPFPPLLGHEGIALAIQGWAKLFVQHHHAKRILEAFVRHEGREIPIDIKVYGVSIPEKSRALPLPTWETVKTVMRSSLSDKTAEDRDKIIDVFKSHFETSDDTNDTAKTDKKVLSRHSKNAIYHTMGAIITHKPNTARYYNIHCEVALAGLVAASQCASSQVARFVDDGLLDELKVGIPSILQLRQLTHM